MKKDTGRLSKAEVNKISDRYIRGVDKWRRMFQGLASNLEKYENNIIYITIKKNTETVDTADFACAKEIVDCWIRWSEALQNASGWVVVMYRTNRSTGFCLHSSALHNDLLADVVNQMKRPEEKQLVGIFSGIL